MFGLAGLRALLLGDGHYVGCGASVASGLAKLCILALHPQIQPYSAVVLTVQMVVVTGNLSDAVWPSPVPVSAASALFLAAATVMLLGPQVGAPMRLCVTTWTTTAPGP